MRADGQAVGEVEQMIVLAILQRNSRRTLRSLWFGLEPVPEN